MTKFFLLILLILPSSIFSQITSASLDVPVFTSGPERSSTDPTIAFDQRVLVQVSGASQPAEFCLFINTRTGDIGIQYGRAGELGACELNVNDRKFRFMLVRSSGQIQTYMTTEKNGELKHYMSTGNTEVYPVSFPGMENAELQRLGSAPPYPRRSGVPSRAYRANTSAPTFYLAGLTEPVSVTTQKFLGYSGIGYLKTNRGVYRVVRADMGPNEYRAFTWHTVPTRLDPDLFQQMEVIMNDGIRATLDRQENKLRSETFSGDCSSQEQEWNRLKLADVEARRGLNRERNAGNVYESETARRATGEMMIPNLEVMNQEITVKICKANVRLSRARSERARSDIEQKIQCHRRTQLELNRLQMEWNAIDARYPNDSGRAYAEKNRTFGRLISLGGECR